MRLASPNKMVWTHFRSLRRVVKQAHETPSGDDQRDHCALATMMSVAAFESFFNIYFRLLVENPQYAQHRQMVLAGLATRSDGRPQGLRSKLNRWPPALFDGRCFAWQSGVALQFDAIRKRRNSLMHFTSSHETVRVPGYAILGLADTSSFDDLTPEDATLALSTAEGMLAKTLQLAGHSDESLPAQLHLWTGKVHLPTS